MQYFALLISPERNLSPEEGGAEMAAYEAFHAKAATAIRGGDALLPAATAVRITGGPDAPIITDGPFVEGAEVAGLPAAEPGGVEDHHGGRRVERGGVEISP